MFRSLVCSLLLLAAGSNLSAQEATTQPVKQDSDSTISRIDTMWVIPAGPIAGAFTTESRLQVVDTVAGWARIQVEGWVPVGRVLDRIESVNYYNINGSVAPKIVPEVRQRCTAITQKGTRCKRMAMPGSDKCWQHQHQE